MAVKERAQEAEKHMEAELCLWSCKGTAEHVLRAWKSQDLDSDWEVLQGVMKAV